MSVPTRWTLTAIGLVTLLIGLVPGCGGGGRPGTISVTGQVTLDGQPLAGAAVMFTGPGGGAPVTAVTDASGNFQLQAVPGQNKVAVAKTEGSGGAGEAELAPPEGAAAPTSPKYLVPPKYANPTTSGITVDVKAGMGPVKIELKSTE